MAFVVTRSTANPDFYIVDRRKDEGPALHPGHISDDDHAEGCFTGWISPTEKAREGKMEPIIFGDVDLLDEMLTRTAFTPHHEGSKKNGRRRESEDFDEPPPRRRRNAISSFLDACTDLLTG
jgi:hypothetical protein